MLVVMRKELKAVRASTGHDWMGDPISFQAYQHLGMVTETIAKAEAVNNEAARQIKKQPEVETKQPDEPLAV